MMNKKLLIALAAVGMVSLGVNAETAMTNTVTIKLTVRTQGEYSETSSKETWKVDKFKVTNKDFTQDSKGKIIEVNDTFYIAGTTNVLPFSTDFDSVELWSGSETDTKGSGTDYSYGSVSFSEDSDNNFVISGMLTDKWSWTEKKDQHSGSMDAVGTGEVDGDAAIIQGTISVSGKTTYTND